MRETPVELDSPFRLADVEKAELRTSPAFGIGATRIEPGGVFPAHRHDHGEEIVVVTGGSVLVDVAGNESELALGDSIAISRGTVHGLRNASAEEPATLSFVKVPFVPGDTVWVENAV